MPETLTLATAPVTAACADRPTRKDWQRRMIDGQLDKPPGYVWPPGRKRDLLGFALALASFNPDGVNLHPTLARLADRAGCSVNQARRNREELWRLGFVEKTDVAYTGVPILAICDPPGYSPVTLPSTVGGAIADGRQNIQENEQPDIDVRAIARGTPSTAKAEEQTSSAPTIHGRPVTGHAKHEADHLAQREAEGKRPSRSDCWRDHKDCDECLTAALASPDDFLQWDIDNWRADQEQAVPVQGGADDQEQAAA